MFGQELAPFKPFVVVKSEEDASGSYNPNKQLLVYEFGSVLPVVMCLYDWRMILSSLKSSWLAVIGRIN